MQKGLVVALVLALVAVAAWFTFANDGKEAPPPGPQQPPAQQPQHPAGAAGMAAADAAERPAAVAANERREIDSGAASAAAATTCSVRGRLVGADGQPRADVELQLQTFALPDDFDVSAVLRRDPGRDGDLPRSRTGVDGRFSFSVAPGRRGRLELVGDELVFGKGEVLLPLVKADLDLGDIEVRAGAVITGLVRDSRGQPVADVKISAARNEMLLGEVSSATSDRDGRFRIGKLRGGRTTLRTASAQFLPATAEFELKAEEQKSGVVLEVATGKAVSGQVLDDLGRPVAGIKVGATRTEARPGMQMERFTPDEATETDAGGWFLLSGLSGESASIRAFGDGYTTATETGVPVGTGNLVLRVQRLAEIAGMLRDTAGKPIAGSRVQALGGRGAGPQFGDLAMPFVEDRRAATTAADGSFHLLGVTPGEVTLRAEGSSHRPVVQRGLQLAPAQSLQGIQLVADLGATARIKVVDDAGKPVADATVRAEQKTAEAQPGGGRFRARRVAIGDDDVHFGDGPKRLGEATTDAAGVAELTGLPGGIATLTAVHGDYAEAQPLELAVPAAGTVEASMAMRRPAWASITVTGPDGSVAGAKFVVHGPIGAEEDERDRPGSVDASGALRFGPLPPGDYFAELELEPNGRAMGGGTFVIGGDSHRLEQSRVHFRLAAGEDTPVALQMPVLAKVHGIVTGVDGPAAGVEVELVRRGDGDAALASLPGLGGPSVQTDAQGSFALEQVEAGDYELVFGKPGQLVKAREPLRVPADTAEVQADLTLRFGRLKLAVYEAGTANGIAGAEVELVPAAAPGADGKAPRPQRVMMFSMVMNNGNAGPESTTMTMGQSRKQTGADGTVEIEDVPPGIYTVRVTDAAHSDCELAAQQVIERQTTDCGKVEMQAAGHIRGTVSGADGRPGAMALVFCRRIGDDEAEPRREPAMGGRFKFDGLAPGRYALKAQQLMGEAQPFGPEVEVEVQAGRAPATAALTLAKE